ncbi:uncharacterized protein LOC111637097 [Centruroides sculpturatus]|uniref:uncharacterized protein LOC111637097 n=1 Tax=Centruroides sculpturatus TaxID=218467 RepID=UPI000C6D471D|nr:uncharacterized protein LOC111637097 [Centruroides sculpturatus]
MHFVLYFASVLVIFPFVQANLDYTTCDSPKGKVENVYEESCREANLNRHCPSVSADTIYFYVKFTSFEDIPSPYVLSRITDIYTNRSETFYLPKTDLCTGFNIKCSLKAGIYNKLHTFFDLPDSKPDIIKTEIYLEMKDGRDDQSIVCLSLEKHMKKLNFIFHSAMTRRMI